MFCHGSTNRRGKIKLSGPLCRQHHAIMKQKLINFSERYATALRTCVTPGSKFALPVAVAGILGILAVMAWLVYPAATAKIKGAVPMSPQVAAEERPANVPALPSGQVSPAAVGENCEYGSPPCTLGLLCLGKDDTKQTPGVCHSVADAFSAAAGAPCDLVAGDLCSPGCDVYF